MHYTLNIRRKTWVGHVSAERCALSQVAQHLVSGGLGSIKDGEFPGQLNDYQLLRKAAAPRS